MIDIPKVFGSMVFNESTMKEDLPEDVYNKLAKTIWSGQELDLKGSNIIADAMKNWAVKKGATHYAHWFQPMVGIAAEKHDSFITKCGHGKVIMEFSGKELIKGESDASSFPSGGLRTTFEARGYTAWDPTSYVFIKDKVLYIPTVFCSFSGETLDNKAPLLKSMENINEQALRILRLFGDKITKRVIPTVGAEQEYFLIDQNLYKRRPDLVLCKRTLFGAVAPKTQRMEDHYFSSMSDRVTKFMQELDLELWKLGILAKTKHNEVAPCQFELAPIFTSVNLAADNNQLIMERLKTIALRHGFVCILHEKPFYNINGSGKHNNWSLNTDNGINLFDMGSSFDENARFILFLCAVIKAADEYQDLLRASVATCGNDCRFGENEAPPNIISIFLGKELESTLVSFANGKAYKSKKKSSLEIGVNILPELKKDNVDRNRTSPLAFTGNKFEFRMLGASCNISWPNIVLNTIVAEELSKFADVLEKSKNFKSTIKQIVSDTINHHRRIIYNGDNYSKKWKLEAKRRGLSCLNSTEEALSKLLSEKNIEVFVKNKIYTNEEIRSRYNALIQDYKETISVEVKVMLEMVRREILPAGIKYIKFLSDSINSVRSFSPEISIEVEKDLICKMTDSINDINKLSEYLSRLFSNRIYESEDIGSTFYKDKILPAMQQLRSAVDQVEINIGKAFWPYPTYEEILFK